MSVAVWAVLGALIWWQARDDDTEVVGPFRLTSSAWKCLIIIAAAVLLYDAGVGIGVFAVVLAVFVAVLTAPHNILLSPPAHQVLSRPRDALQVVLFRLFKKKAGQVCGLPLYIAYSIMRYCAPISIMGAITQTWPLLVAGPLASIAYYPWKHSEQSKYVRAAIVGGIVMASLAAVKYDFAGF